MKNGATLHLPRCPNCGIAAPNLQQKSSLHTFLKTDSKYTGERVWTLYECASCGKVVLTEAEQMHNSPSLAMDIENIWPAPQIVPIELPERARQFLEQALDCVGAPAGSILLAAGAVDSMLKNKGYTEGVLNTRINEAAEAHLLTPEMAAWAHEIKLDANDQRHADEASPLPNQADAQKVIRFALALAQFLYVLPAMVQRGREKPKQPYKVPTMPKAASREQVRSNAGE